MSGRHDFLRGLVSLPLIGGSVTLIGQPRAVAEPVTEQMLVAYQCWLSHEFDRATHDLYGSDNFDTMRRSRSFMGPGFVFHRHSRGDHPMDTFGNHSPPPATRAALVLSAVGCDWRA